jgi:hypothetical protein
LGIQSWYWHPSGRSNVVLPGDWLVLVFGSFCPQGKLQLGAEVTHCQFVQGGQSCCCFHQVAAVLPFSCNSVWSASPSARWGNSVLNTALCPMRSALGCTTYPAWGGGLVTSPPLSAFVPLLTFAGCQWLLWEVSLLPHPTVSLCCFSTFVCLALRVWFLAPSLFSGAGSAFHPHLHCQY